MKILVTVDGSDYTRRMLDYLCRHAKDLGAGNAYTVLHVVLAVSHHAAAFAGASIVRNYYEDEAKQVLDPARRLLSERGFTAEFAHRVGRPAEEIASFAAHEGFDLIVMGSHGHGALANLVLGSVATKVLACSTIPVLIVR